MGFRIVEVVVIVHSISFSEKTNIISLNHTHIDREREREIFRKSEIERKRERYANAHVQITKLRLNQQ